MVTLIYSLLCQLSLAVDLLAQRLRRFEDLGEVLELVALLSAVSQRRHMLPGNLLLQTLHALRQLDLLVLHVPNVLMTSAMASHSTRYKPS
jgi:hypothetical protein